MPIRFDEGEAPCAVFERNCTAEEADALLDWLRRTSEPLADLGGCEILHTALAQLLLAARVRLVAPLGDALLTQALSLPVAARSAIISPPTTASRNAKPRRPRPASAGTQAQVTP